MFKIEIRTDNSAFEDRGYELHRILDNLAAMAIRGDFNQDEPDTGTIKDTNGNTVGSWFIVP